MATSSSSSSSSERGHAHELVDELVDRTLLGHVLGRLLDDGGSTPSPTTATPLARSKPTAVRLPSIDVDSPVHGLGLDAQGRLMVPSGDRYDEVARYDGSPTPGEVGPAVLEGHVTGSGRDPSVFFELGATRSGDPVEVDRADGSTATFEVTDVRMYPKADFPRVDVYGATAGPELRIITCGGSYDSSARRHLDNVVVFAKLVEG
ncbi:class F sortase [Janibacter limosus]|uniref:class F sortase n=1 Tax=Janibacter limosus TaxID=53458 RepID=UPI0035DAA4A5|nr:class F sortase [Janibacter limosus]